VAFWWSMSLHRRCIVVEWSMKRIGLRHWRNRRGIVVESSWLHDCGGSTVESSLPADRMSLAASRFEAINSPRPVRATMLAITPGRVGPPRLLRCAGDALRALPQLVASSAPPASTDIAQTRSMMGVLASAATAAADRWGDVEAAGIVARIIATLVRDAAGRDVSGRTGRVHAVARAAASTAAALDSAVATRTQGELQVEPADRLELLWAAARATLGTAGAEQAWPDGLFRWLADDHVFGKDVVVLADEGAVAGSLGQLTSTCMARFACDWSGAVWWASATLLALPVDVLTPKSVSVDPHGDSAVHLLFLAQPEDHDDDDSDDSDGAPAGSGARSRSMVDGCTTNSADWWIVHANLWEACLEPLARELGSLVIVSRGALPPPSALTACGRLRIPVYAVRERCAPWDQMWLACGGGQLCWSDVLSRTLCSVRSATMAVQGCGTLSLSPLLSLFWFLPKDRPPACAPRLLFCSASPASVAVGLVDALRRALPIMWRWSSTPRGATSLQDAEEWLRAEEEADVLTWTLLESDAVRSAVREAGLLHPVLVGPRRRRPYSLVAPRLPQHVWRALVSLACETVYGLLRVDQVLPAVRQRPDK
jgi:hypothetical protein